MQTQNKHERKQGARMSGEYERPALEVVRLPGDGFAACVEYSPSGDNSASGDEEGLF